MEKCDICGKEGTLFTQTFKDNVVDPITLCRTCRGKLLLTLPPKDVTPEQVKGVINKLYEEAEALRSRQHRRR